MVAEISGKIMNSSCDKELQCLKYWTRLQMWINNTTTFLMKMAHMHETNLLRKSVSINRSVTQRTQM